LIALLPVLASVWPIPTWPAEAECIVVRVVVSDRRDGAGEEKVLSAPLPVLGPPPTVPAVPAVPAPEEGAPWDCAASECATSCSVETVGAIDPFPTAWGW
jgi:hypothetical protein